jgi:hypothetical protein
MDPAGKSHLLIRVDSSQFATGMSFVHCAPPRVFWNPKSPDFGYPKPGALDSIYRQNKSPSAIALGDWFPLRTYVLTSKASPNDLEIVIIVIIIGEAKLVLHMGGIIAQTVYLAESLTAHNIAKCMRLRSCNLETNGGYGC